MQKKLNHWMNSQQLAWESTIQKKWPRNNKCIQYKGNQEKSGYGRVWFRERKWLAHRVSYTVNIGEIPEGLCVLHRCDNRLCINIRHLFLGTYSDNTIDMHTKGRGRKIHLRGQDTHTAKLTNKEVLKIKTFLKNKTKQLDIAEIFNISPQSVCDIKKGRTWKHV